MKANAGCWPRAYLGRWGATVEAMVFAKRKRVTAAVRAHIMYAQDYCCAECSVKLPIGWEVDHRIPLSSERWEQLYVSRAAATAAANALENLQALCPNCHNRKSFLERDADTAALVSRPRPAKPVVQSWNADRARRRTLIDRLWLFERPGGDPLTQRLMQQPLWNAVSGAQDDTALRKIYRNLPWRASVPFAVFKRRVDHLVSA